LGEQAAIALALASSDFHQHFLERFLVRAGRMLRVPWWSVHLFLFLTTWAVSIVALDICKLFPRLSLPSMAMVALAEFGFTTFMLVQIRRCRAQAFVLAARIDGEKERLIWLRRYLGPIHWGWIISTASDRHAEPKRIVHVRLSHLTIIVLALFYAHWLCFVFLPGSPGIWAIYKPHIFWFYTHTAKASMLVAVLGYFSWLTGTMKIARGNYANCLSLKQRQLLYFESCRTAIRLSVAVGAVTGLWMFAHGIACGVTYWSYLLCLCLMFLFFRQITILSGRPLFSLNTSGEWLAPLLAIVQSRAVFRPGELLAVLASIACPAALNQLGAFAGGFLSG